MLSIAGTVIAVLASWVLGSIPTAYVVTKIATGKDIRAIGSGNPGATNVFRALGARYAVPVFIVDFLKGFLPVLAILRVDVRFMLPAPYLALLCGAACVIGHLFPVFVGWRGGKGVATGAGVVTALYPPLFPACLTVFATALLVTRRMSVASIATSLSVPALYATIAILKTGSIDVPLLAFMTVIPAMVIARHRRNIERLANGSEGRLF